MEHREFRRIGRSVGVIGLGAWQLGADWGSVSDQDALGVLQEAVDCGVDFFDTADVYGDGRSEQLIGRFLADHPDHDVMVATKMGRRADQVAENYVRAQFLLWNDRSRANLGVETLDLVQLHCPPTGVYSSDAVYETLDEMVDEGRIAAYGFSVESCDQALAAIARPNVASIQIILNAFRLKPLERVLGAAGAAGVGVIARVPLASGLLSGRYDTQTVFAADDHRAFNRAGQAFDVGETFSGVPFDVGLAAVDELMPAVPPGASLAQFALRWVLDQPGVTVAIPGARSGDQVRANAAAAQMSGLDDDQLARVDDVYDRHIRPLVHGRW